MTAETVFRVFGFIISFSAPSFLNSRRDQSTPSHHAQAITALYSFPDADTRRNLPDVTLSFQSP
jgi:hypothetical protein